MLNKRIFLLIASLVFGLFAVWGGARLGWTPLSANLTYAAAAIFFLGIMISSQQYEEDVISKAERLLSAFLFSYILFFRLLYAPISNLFFGKLIKEASFFADTLALFLFLLFFFLFGTSFLILNSYTRIGFLRKWTFFNNEKMFFILRFFFIAFVGIFVMLYARNSFFSLKNSNYINGVLTSATCGWAFRDHIDPLQSGRVISGENVCLFYFAKDKQDPEDCKLILDEEIKNRCIDYVSARKGN
jgi:hypothetical protein